MQEEFPYAAGPKLLTHFGTDQNSTARLMLSWKERILRLEEPPAGQDWRGVPSSLAIVGFITIVGFWIEPHIQGSNLAIFYMLAVVFSAVRWGRRAVAMSA